MVIIVKVVTLKAFIVSPFELLNFVLEQDSVIVNGVKTQFSHRDSISFPTAERTLPWAG